MERWPRWCKTFELIWGGLSDLKEPLFLIWGGAFRKEVLSDLDLGGSFRIFWLIWGGLSLDLGGSFRKEVLSELQRFFQEWWGSFKLPSKKEVLSGRLGFFQKVTVLWIQYEVLSEMVGFFQEWWGSFRFPTNKRGSFRKVRVLSKSCSFVSTIWGSFRNGGVLSRMMRFFQISD